MPNYNLSMPIVIVESMKGGSLVTRDTMKTGHTKSVGWIMAAAPIAVLTAWMASEIGVCQALILASLGFWVTIRGVKSAGLCEYSREEPPHEEH